MPKDTVGKPNLLLIPYNALAAVAAVREYGMQKYGDAWSWKTQVRSEDFQVAAVRHLFKATESGMELDEESGLLHLAHAATSALMALEIALQNAAPVAAVRPAEVPQGLGTEELAVVPDGAVFNEEKTYINQEDLAKLSLLGKIGLDKLRI